MIYRAVFDPNRRIKGYLDGVDVSREQFYKNLPTYPVHPTTAAPSPLKFHAVYDALADEGATEILSIHISVALRAVMDTARIAAQETKSIPVTVFDSRQLSLGTGFLVEAAAKLAAQGKTMGEIINALNDQIRRTRVFAALDTLEFLKRSGRMNGVMAGLNVFATQTDSNDVRWQARRGACAHARARHATVARNVARCWEGGTYRDCAYPFA